jgi:hypothetical protein
MSEMISTDSSSKGVLIVSMPAAFTLPASSAKASMDSFVSLNRFTYLRSVRVWKSGWMKVSS